MNKLTYKQDHFARLFVEHGVSVDAYRVAYDVKSEGQWVAIEASRSLRHPLVALKIKEIRERLEEEAVWKRLNSIEVLAEIARGLDEEAKPSDKVQAVKALNQMMGWERRVLDHQSSDGTMQPPTTIVIKAATEHDRDDHNDRNDDRDDQAAE